jgi:hypothetical protein
VSDLITAIDRPQNKAERYFFYPAELEECRNLSKEI